MLRLAEHLSRFKEKIRPALLKRRGFQGGVRNFKSKKKKKKKTSGIAKPRTQNKYTVSSLTIQTQMGLGRKYLQKVMRQKTVFTYCEHVFFVCFFLKGNLQLFETST